MSKTFKIGEKHKELSGHIRDDFINELLKMRKCPAPAPVLNCKELAVKIRKLQKQGKRVVWTNGCFDILHAGHVLLLQQARALGDFLVVGLNNDSSVKKLKGSERPCNRQKHRAMVIASLISVDFVTIFRGDTPLQVLEKIRPDIYAKGGDYSVDTVNQDERKLVESYGGKVVTLAQIKNLSTSKILGKMKKDKPV